MWSSDNLVYLWITTASIKLEVGRINLKIVSPGKHAVVLLLEPTKWRFFSIRCRYKSVPTLNFTSS